MRFSKSVANAAFVTAPLARAKAAVVGFRRRHHMLDVGLVLCGRSKRPCVGEASARIRPVDLAHAGHDPLLNGLGVGIVGAVVGRAAVLWSDWGTHLQWWLCASV